MNHAQKTGSNLPVRLRSLARQLYQKIPPSTISKRLLMVLVVLLFLCAISCIICFTTLYDKTLDNSAADIATQTVESTYSNTSSLLDTINTCSKSILSDSAVQSALMGSSEQNLAVVSQQMRTLLTNRMESISALSSIYLFDLNGHVFHSSRSGQSLEPVSDPTQADTWDTLRECRGGYQLLLNGGGFLRAETKDTYISHARLINSTQTAKPIGLLVINIDVEKLFTIVSANAASVDIAVTNSEGTVILPFSISVLSDYFEQTQGADIPKQGCVRHIADCGKCYLYQEAAPSTGWYYICAVRYSAFQPNRSAYIVTGLILVTINCLLVLMSLGVVQGTIVRPIRKLVQAIRDNKGGFQKISVVTEPDELAEMQSAYNQMLGQIETLLHKSIDEQRFKRKAELGMLQAQIHPHFLYNSLDAIAYMTLAGESQTAYELVLALSNYYRGSLSKGREVITLGDEISIVQNYLFLQKTRFPGQIEDEYDIDESLSQMLIPKLVLQPLVENSIHHGIQPKGECGTIRIRAQTVEDIVVAVTVEDDGIGMTEQKLHEILDGNLEQNTDSFGLRGTIERLKIFYRKDDIYEIKSVYGVGTRITLFLPYLRRIDEGGGKTESSDRG